MAEEIEAPLLGGGPKKGGIRTLPFIIANESIESCVSTGMSSNFTPYLMGKYGMSAVRTSNLLYMRSTISGITPLVGAFLADSYTGRFRIIAIGSVLTSLGMTLLWLTSAIPQARPHCEKSSSHCDSPTAFHLFVLYSSFMLMCVGAGGIRGSSLAFGGDQLVANKNKSKNKRIFESFIGWYYVFTLVGSLFGMTVVVYIQDNISWNLGFGIPAALMLLSLLFFFIVSPLFVKVEPSASLFTSIFQVIVASLRNRHVRLPSETSQALYHHREASALTKPSDKLRFLNKACIITKADEGRSPDPWRVCRVEQVEDLKSIIKVIPIWSTGILFSVSFNQNTLPYLQISTMDRHITPKFEVPAGSFTMFLFIFLGLWILLYDRLLVPLATRIRGKPTRLKPLQKVGFGIIMSCIAVASIGIVEIKRRAMAIEQGFSDDPHAVVKMSAFWLLPHYIFGGIADASCVIGQNEFFYSQLPKSMSSVATSLSGLSMSAGSLLAGFIMTAVDDVTKAGGGDSWVSSNINKARYDYYFFFISGLCFLDLLYFVACCRSYDGGDDEDETCKLED